MSSARRREPSPTSRGTYPLPGSIIDNKYVVAEVLGSGGMGVVVSARHIGLNQSFAIKFLVAGIDDPETVQRFVREARAASELKSEHVVRVSDVGELPTGQPYMVMEYLEGDDLGSILDVDGPIRITEAVGFVLQACEALAEAHSRGIIHRDLKPGNLFLTSRPDGTAQIKVVDFGVSKVARRDTTEMYETNGHSLLGSPYYMSPEQVRSATSVDARSDIWSMGVTLYELLTGQRAFVADTIPALSVKIVSDPFTPASRIRRELPAGIDAIIRKCLSKDPELRYQSAAELASALSPFAGSDARIAGRRAIRITRQSGSDQPGAGPAVGSSQTGLSVEIPPKSTLDEPPDSDPSPTDALDTHRPASRRRPVAMLAIGVLGFAAIGLTTRMFTSSPSPIAGAVATTDPTASTASAEAVSRPAPVESTASPPPESSQSAEVRAPAPPRSSPAIAPIPTAPATPAASSALDALPSQGNTPPNPLIGRH